MSSTTTTQAPGKRSAVGVTPGYLTPREIADQILQCDYDAVLGWIKTGELRAVGLGREGGRPFRVAPAALDAFLTGRIVAPKTGLTLVSAPKLDTAAPDAEPERSVVTAASPQRRGGRRTRTNLVQAA